MLELTDAQIGTWVATFILPLFRVTAVLMTMPIFGTRMLPARIRLYVAVAITVVIVPALPPLPEFDPLSLRGLLLCGEQVIVGALFGFSCSCCSRPSSSPGRLSPCRWAWPLPPWSTRPTGST